MNHISLIIDLIMVLIFVVFIINGRKKGFINTVLSLAASVIAILIAYEYAMPVAQWADGAFIKSAAVNTFSEAISAHISSGTQAVIDAVPSYITEAVAASGASVQDIISGIGSSINAEQAAEQIYGAIYNIVILPVLTVVAFLVIYAIISFILSFAVKAIDKVFKLPGLKGLNKILGGLLGAVKGAVAVAILCVVLITFKVFLQPEFLATAIDEAMIPNLIADIILK